MRHHEEIMPRPGFWTFLDVRKVTFPCTYSPEGLYSMTTLQRWNRISVWPESKPSFLKVLVLAKVL